MPRLWHYRIGGQQNGPLEFVELQRLFHEARISPDAEVRDDRSRTWLSARTVPELFEAPTKPVDDQSRPPIQTGGTQSGGSTKRDDCYCRFQNEVLGPMSFDLLAGLVRSGRIAAGDQVRLSSHEEWADVSSIPELFGNPTIVEPVADDATVKAAEILNELEIVPDPTPQKRRSKRSKRQRASSRRGEGREVRHISESDVTPVSNVAALSGTPSHQPVEPAAQWYWRIELGPVSWRDLHALVAAQKLKADDRLRAATADDWTPAGTIEGLFRAVSPAAVPAPPVAVPAALAATSPPAEAASPVAAVTPAVQAAHVSAAAVESQPTIDDPATSASPPTQPESQPLPQRVEPAGPTIRVALPRPRRRFQNPLRGLGSAIGSGVAATFVALGSLGSTVAEGMAAQWKALSALVAVVAVVGAFLMYPSSTDASKSATIYADTKQMWDTATRLRQQNRPDEWRAFTAQAVPQSTALVNELQSQPALNPMLDLMLKCHRDCLPKILKGNANENPEEWRQMGQYMHLARGLKLPQ